MGSFAAHYGGPRIFIQHDGKIKRGMLWSNMMFDPLIGVLTVWRLKNARETFWEYPPGELPWMIGNL
jgi:hypothetical protein